MTDACENIAFPQLLLRTVNIAILTPVNSVVTTTEKDVLITAFGIYLFMGEEVGNVTCIMGYVVMREEQEVYSVSCIGLLPFIEGSLGDGTSVLVAVSHDSEEHA